MNMLRDRIAAIRASAADDRAAESTEIILVLVLLVIGLIGAWATLKDKISGRATSVGNCLEQADAANTCAN